MNSPEPDRNRSGDESGHPDPAQLRAWATELERAMAPLSRLEHTSDKLLAMRRAVMDDIAAHGGHLPTGRHGDSLLGPAADIDADQVLQAFDVSHRQILRLEAGLGKVMGPTRQLVDGLRSAADAYEAGGTLDEQPAERLVLRPTTDGDGRKE